MPRPGHRLVIFLFHRWATPRSISTPWSLAGASTLLAILFVRLDRPTAPELWLRPRTDPSCVAVPPVGRRAPVASVPAPVESGGRWRPERWC